MAMGKHLPSCEPYQFLGTSSDFPTMNEPLDYSRQSTMIPFANATIEGLDSIMAGGCAKVSEGLEAVHPYWSENTVQNLLRDGQYSQVNSDW